MLGFDGINQVGRNLRDGGSSQTGNNFSKSDTRENV